MVQLARGLLTLVPAGLGRVGHVTIFKYKKFRFFETNNLALETNDKNQDFFSWKEF